MQRNAVNGAQSPPRRMMTAKWRRTGGAVARAFMEGLEPRCLLAYTPPVDPRVDVSLDSTWKFFKGDPAGAQNVGFNDSSWGTVNLPHTWNNLDGQDGGDNYYRGTGWYRDQLAIPS